MDDKVKISIGVVCVLAIGLLMWFIVLPPMVTDARLERAARTAEARNIENGYVFKDLKDWWGNPIRIKSGPTENKKAYVYMAISAGRDGRYNTDDDRTDVKIDWNKSRIIGEYAGSKAREVVKGWLKGWKEKTKWDD